MANKPKRKEVMLEQINIRLTLSHRHKLDEIARATGRTASEVIRQLIERAELSGQPDIALKSKP